MPKHLPVLGSEKMMDVEGHRRVSKGVDCSTNFANWRLEIVFTDTAVMIFEQLYLEIDDLICSLTT